MRGSGTRTRVTTDSKFGSACCFVEPTAGATFRGVIWQDSASGTTKMPASSATIYTFSAWVKAQSPATQLRIAADCYDATPTYLGGLTGSVGGSWTIEPEQGWVRIYVTGTTPVGTTQFDPEVSLATTDGKKFWVDGYQVEQQPLATPYIETNGSTASRSASQVTQTTGGDALVTPTQGWVALRVRHNWGTSNEPAGGSGFPQYFNRAGTGSNRILFFYQESLNNLRLARDTSAPDMNDAVVSFSPVAGNVYTLIGTWTATQVGVSINGATFTKVANSNIPTITNTFSIGGVSDCDYFWFACGTGTLTDADASLLNSFGNTAPAPWALPSTSQTTLVWDAIGSQGYEATDNNLIIYPPLASIIYPPI